MIKNTRKSKEKMVQAVLRLPKNYLDLAKEIGRNEYTSYSAVLRRAIIEWIEQKKLKRGKNE